jgi:hypothetical protein
MAKASRGAGGFFCFALLSLASLANGRTLTVNTSETGDYATIQQAVDAAARGDTVLVAPGTYVSSATRSGRTACVFLRDGVHLISVAGAGATVIDGEDAHAVVVADGLGDLTRIEGFTVRRGRAGDGAGLWARDARLHVARCRFEENRADSRGGGILLRDAVAVLEDCRVQGNLVSGPGARGGGVALVRSLVEIAGAEIHQNTAAGTSNAGPALGGGLAEEGSRTLLHHSLFFGNVCSGPGGSRGGAVHVTPWADGVPEGGALSAYLKNTFVGNRAELPGAGSPEGGADGAAVFFEAHTRASIRRNIVAMNRCVDGNGEPVADGGAMALAGTGSITNECNLFWQNEPLHHGNIDPGYGTAILDPLFCGTSSVSSGSGGNDFHLQPDSPALPANNPCGSQIGARGAGACGEAACGVSLDPPPAQAGGAGEVLTFVFRVTNTGEGEDRFALRASETHRSWLLEHPDSTEHILPGASEDVPVVLHIPEWADWTTHHLVTLTAWSSCAAPESSSTLAAVDVVVQHSSLTYEGGGVRISWSVASQQGDERFYVYRRDASGGSPGLVSPSEGLHLDPHGGGSWVDRSVEQGRSYAYSLGAVEGDGTETTVELGEIAIPARGLLLGQNSPNPFNPTTRISFYLPEPGLVRLSVFDPGGREVTVLVSGFREAGEHTVTWNGRDAAGRPVASGTYFYRLHAGKHRETRKMTLLQ